MGSAIWLYPINGKRDHSFKVGRWQSEDTSAAAFAKMIRLGATDRRWGIKKNHKNVSKGHLVVVYATKTASANRSPLIVGVGTIEGVHRLNDGDHEIEIDWDVERCLRLANRPIDAAKLANHLPATKPSVTAIPEKFWPSLRHQLSLPDAGPTITKGDAGRIAAQVRNVTVKARQYEAIVRHDAKLVAPLHKRLNKVGWERVRVARDVAPVDYLAKSPDGTRYLLIEAKTLASNDGRNEIRFAIGQLLDYEHFVRPTLAPRAVVDRLIFLEGPPAPKLVRFVESLGLGIAWRSKRGLGAGLETRANLTTLGVIGAQRASASSAHTTRRTAPETLP